MLGDGELARQIGKASDAQMDCAGQLEVAGSVKARGQRAGDREAVDPGDFGRAGDTTALLSVGADQDGAGTVLQGHRGAAGLKRGVRVAGVDDPAAAAVRRLIEHDVKGAAKCGRTEVQRAIERDVEYRAAVGQRDRLGGVQRNRRAQVVGGAVPVDHRTTGTEHIAADAELAIHGQAGAGDVSLCQRLQRCAADGSLAGKPAPAAAAFGRQDHGDVGLRQAGTNAGVAQGRSNTGTAENKLIDCHRAAVGEQHRLVGPGLDEHLAVDREYATDVGVHHAAQTGFVVDQVDGVAAAGRANADGKITAPAVVGDLQSVGSEREAGNASQRDVAFCSHRVFLRDAAAGGAVTQHDGTAAVRQRHAKAAGGQAAREAVNADGQVGDGGAADHLSGGDDLQAAREIAQIGDTNGARTDGDFLAAQTIGKRHLARRRADAGLDRHVDGAAQSVDLDDGVGAERDRAVEALQAGAARCVERVARLGGDATEHRRRVARDDQANADVGQADAGAGCANCGAGIGGTDQQVVGRLLHGS